MIELSDPSPTEAPPRAPALPPHLIDAQWHGACIPQRHAMKAEDGGLRWPEPRVVEKAVQHLGRRRCVVLSGPRGTGKTQLAAAVVREIVTRWECSTRYWLAREIMNQFRSLITEHHDLERFRTSLRYQRFLVIDDVQEIGSTPFELDEFTWLMDKRYCAELPTMLITNTQPSCFADAMGPSVASRLDEWGVLVECDWPSYRGAMKMLTEPGSTPRSSNASR